ncbi:MAG: hypothetical protein LH609_18350 [Rudanella sp.]|nr:hypothetical protein [Rudanella sp.]
MTIQPKETERWLCKGLLMGAFFLTTALSSESLAQSENRHRNDPTYSIRNYKHPNKATAARAWESGIIVSLRERGQRRIYIGDYKHVANREPERSGLVVKPRRNRNTNPELLSGHNYKNPRPWRAVANREPRKPARPVELVLAEETPTGND